MHHKTCVDNGTAVTNNIIAGGSVASRIEAVPIHLVTHTVDSYG